MEKIKGFVITVMATIAVILIYSLSKSWLYFEKGVELNEEPQTTETLVKETPKDTLSENSRVIWKNYLYYPTDLVREAGGFGPEEVMNHARNITFVNLTTGKVRKLFEKKIYILDYFPGEFTKKTSKNNEVQKDSIDIGNRMLIFAMQIDTNKDGFLNNKDLIQVFIYSPQEEKLDEILPKGYFFEKLLLNTRKNTLVSVVKKQADTKEADEELTTSAIFTYDVVEKKGTIIHGK
ncbi:MAG: hypothetical protein IPL26_01785 [Leptospiraceae bacterium]|nr:hypothetical protein [Leptospiraceae bacterium]